MCFGRFNDTYVENWPREFYECHEDACAWWHGGLCDVSRIACSLAAIEVAELADTRDHITDHGESVLIGLNESYSGGDA